MYCDRIIQYSVEKKGGEGLTPALITPEEVVISFLQLSFWWLSSL